MGEIIVKVPYNIRRVWEIDEGFTMQDLEDIKIKLEQVIKKERKKEILKKVVGILDEEVDLKKERSERYENFM